MGTFEKFRYIGKAFINLVRPDWEKLEYVVEEISKMESAKDLIEKKIEALKADEQKLRKRLLI